MEDKFLMGCLYQMNVLRIRGYPEEVGWFVNLIWKKAYDHVNCRFVDYILLRMGFGTKRRSWIFFCILSSSLVLINGSPTRFLNGSRGLRLGNLLSLFLFMMVSEVLSGMIKKAEMCFTLGFSVRSGGVAVFHLRFTNDTMIFCDANVRQLRYLRCILKCFEVVSGLNINLAKSEIFQVDENCDMESFAWILGCSHPSYLGLLLGTRYKSKVLWELVIKKMSSRLRCGHWRPCGTHTWLGGFTREDIIFCLCPLFECFYFN